LASLDSRRNSQCNLFDGPIFLIAKTTSLVHSQLLKASHKIKTDDFPGICARFALSCGEPRIVSRKIKCPPRDVCSLLSRPNLHIRRTGPDTR
jgi:hypothetical protein